jgi:hypothetical protein
MKDGDRRTIHFSEYCGGSMMAIIGGKNWRPETVKGRREMTSEDRLRKRLIKFCRDAGWGEDADAIRDVLVRLKAAEEANRSLYAAVDPAARLLESDPSEAFWHLANAVADHRRGDGRDS